MSDETTPAGEWPPRLAIRLNVDVSGFTRALRKALTSLRSVFHRVPHPRSAKCRICNPRGNPPPAPWAADYRRKTRRRNR